MFRQATLENTKRARAPSGNLNPISIPYKGLNARSPFTVMGPEYAISLYNVIEESIGLRTRKGYREFANNIPGGGIPISTVMPYWPNTGVAQIFAAKGGSLYDVTAGGAGTWTAELVVTGLTDFWTSLNFQNVAGSFLCAVNDGGGYSYYDGATWANVAMGAGPGQIDNVDPDLFVHIAEFKKSLWFTEKDSTSAWFLAAENITGAASEFDFGAEFSHGGYLVGVCNWTLDGGNGPDDYLVACGSNGDIVLYKGTDPTSSTDFNKVGTFYCGPLPSGRRCFYSTGSDVYILSQFGLVPLSKLLSSGGGATEPDMMKQHISYQIDPTLAELMSTYAYTDYWQIFDVPREELQIIMLPPGAAANLGTEAFLYKVPMTAWSRAGNMGYAHLVSVGLDVFAGTLDGRVVKAFSGALDNVLIGTTAGNPINCQVVPAYNQLGNPGLEKRVVLIRPAFLTLARPVVSIKILVDFGVIESFSVPTLPSGVFGGIWDASTSLWDSALWGGNPISIHEWLGCSGTGYAVTPQIDYACAGETLLTNVDFWTEAGGVLG